MIALISNFKSEVLIDPPYLLRREPHRGTPHSSKEVFCTSHLEIVLALGWRCLPLDHLKINLAPFVVSYQYPEGIIARFLKPDITQAENRDDADLVHARAIRHSQVPSHTQKLVTICV